MNPKRTLIALAMASTFLTAFSGVGLATDWNVDTLRYQNRGSYSVALYVVWPLDKDTKCRLVRNEAIGPAESADYNIGGTNSRWKINDEDIDSSCKNGPKEGDEVWMRFEIVAGDKQTCLKDENRFYYKTGGGTIKYDSIGTTLNRNRCRIQSLPDDQHKIKPELPTPVPLAN